MTPPDKTPEEKKVKIRPRVTPRERDEDPLEAEKHEKLLSRIEEIQKNRLKQSGSRKASQANGSDDDAAGSPDDVAPDDPEKTWGMGGEELAGSPAKERRKQHARHSLKRLLFRWGRVAWNHRLPTVPVAVVFFIVLAFVVREAHKNGVAAGRAKAKAEATKENRELTTDQLEGLNRALELVRNGKADEAVTALLAFQQKYPQVASVNYLIGLAATRAGQSVVAADALERSIGRRERLSDSLAMRAILETKQRENSPIRTMGDPRIRSEQYLRRAVAVDPANPHPMILLGAFLRFQGKTDEARAMLEGARSRLQPLDSATVVDVSLALMDVTAVADKDLPEPDGEAFEPAAMFSNALIAFRKGQPDLAVALLKKAETRLAQGVFRNLMHDPALREYLQDPAVRSQFDPPAKKVP